MAGARWSLGDWWFGTMSGSPARDAGRLAALRVWIFGFAIAYLALRFGDLIAAARLAPAQFEPVGVVRVLAHPLPVAVVVSGAALTLALLVAAWLGAAYRLTAPAAAAALLWTLSYRNSWGQVFHTENLLVLHVAALALAPAAQRFVVGRPQPMPRAGSAWAIRLLIALTVITYVLAGVAKLRLAGVSWVDGDQLRNQVAIDNLRKAVLGAEIAPFATPLLDHPSAFIGLSVLTVILELGSPVALLGGPFARGWALSAWAFHVGVILVMNIWFPYPLAGMAYLPIVAADRPLVWAVARWRRVRAGIPAR